ncbi:MAG: ThiF family adenylyltransferase, partial [Woeseiaceae bacterium]
MPRPDATAYPLAVQPALDGDVRNDPAWRDLQAISGLVQVQPNQGAPASKKTEVFVGFTDTALWIGFIGHDDNPDSIIISEGRRDSSLDDTDSFRFLIDGFLDKQNGYVFGTNPTGMQYDAQVIKEGGSGQFTRNVGIYDENWDGSWEVATIVGDFGWSAEFEIPFRTLRYGKAETQVWGVNFQRNIRRNNEIVYWAPIGPQHTITRVSQAGTLRGIDVPAQRNLQITPYVLSSWHRQGDISSSNQEAGLDIKYSITPSLTLDVTYNTDFAQVEVDDVVVNLDRFSIFLPEKRPFFLENAGQFSVGNQQEVELFFSRRIGIVDGELLVPGDLLLLESGVRIAADVRLLETQGLRVDESLLTGESLPVEHPRTLSSDERERYSRHLVIPEVGEGGQTRLLDGKVVLVGAGGLGSPAAYYLAAAGVGTLGIVDDDVVDRSNLQRQILHTATRVGQPKVESARQALAAAGVELQRYVP